MLPPELVTAQKAEFCGEEVVENQQVLIPVHNRVSATGGILPDECSSTTGNIRFSGGFPERVVSAQCTEKGTGKCYFSTRIKKNITLKS